MIHAGGGNVSAHNLSFFRKMFLWADYGRAGWEVKLEPDQTLNTRIDSLSLNPWALGSHGRLSSGAGEGTHRKEFLRECSLEAAHTADCWRKCVSVSVCCLWGECVCVCA